MPYQIRDFTNHYYDPGVHPGLPAAPVTEVIENFLTTSEVDELVARYAAIPDGQQNKLLQVPAGYLVTCRAPDVEDWPANHYPVLTNDGTFKGRPLYGSKGLVAAQFSTLAPMTAAIRARWISSGQPGEMTKGKSATQLNLNRNRIMWRFYHRELVPSGYEVSHMAEPACQDPIFFPDSEWTVIDMVGLETREMNESRKLCKEWGLWILDAQGKIIEDEDRAVTVSRCPHALCGRPCFGCIPEGALAPPTLLSPVRLSTIHGNKPGKTGGGAGAGPSKKQKTTTA